MENRNPRFPNKNLILGIILILFGSILLLWQLGFLPSLGKLWPLPILLLGLFFLYRVFLAGKSPKYLIPGMLLSLIAAFFILINTVITESKLEQIWPAFMLITGLSILPYGLYKKSRKARLTIIIPVIAIIVLSIVFFMFSLDLINENFVDFALKWWPSIIVLSGLIMIVLYFIKIRRLKAQIEQKNSKTI
jgi:hypothetical protein